ncbi:MAG: Carbohydrate binding family 11 [Chitinophagaceae bacterium]|nr:Carbohydrate binding family 11 [Chitinophagaceae bacterium]
MKKIIFYFSLFSVCSINAFSQKTHTKEDVWIDRFDFEGAGSKTFNRNTLRGETWLTLSDVDNKGASTISPNFIISDKEHGKVLQVNYTLNQGELKYDPYVGIYCTTRASSYPKHIVYVAYDYKGPKHAFQFCTNDVTDYNYYRKNVPASEEWTTILIPIADLEQSPDFGNGEKPPLHAEELKALQWFIQGKAGDTGSLLIDNIRFVYTPIEGRNYKD